MASIEGSLHDLNTIDAPSEGNTTYLNNRMKTPMNGRDQSKINLGNFFAKSIFQIDSSIVDSTSIYTSAKMKNLNLSN